MSVIDITVYRLPVNSNRYLWLLDADKAKDVLLNGILRDEWKFKGFVLAAGLIALEVLTIRRYQKRKNTVA